MKELSTEEKAKRYEEAIEKLHEIITMNNKPVNPKEIGEYLFPELKESEDERIRKQIISFLKEFEHDHYRSLDFSSWIAWLEKQGEQNLHVNDNAKEMFIKALERVEEQNSKDYKLTDCDKNSWWEDFKTYTSEQNLANSAKTCKVEPKFKVGDWVLWDNKISCFVNNIYRDGKSLMYAIIDTNNMIRTYSVKGFDNNAHLWTIEDAKKGDVLVSAINQPFIYNGKFTEYTVGAYCGLNVYGVFVVGKYLKESNWTNNDNIRPATKEQRDILMREIHRANFKWDTDKKELKNCKL